MWTGVLQSRMRLYSMRLCSKLLGGRGLSRVAFYQISTESVLSSRGPSAAAGFLAWRLFGLLSKFFDLLLIYRMNSLTQAGPGRPSIDEKETITAAC